MQKNKILNMVILIACFVLIFTVATISLRICLAPHKPGNALEYSESKNGLNFAILGGSSSEKTECINKITNDLSHSLEGYIYVDSYLIGANNQKFTFASDFLFNEKYFTLRDGRFPNPQNTTSTYAEILIPDMRGGEALEEIGAEAKINFLSGVNEITLKVVGIYKQSNFYVKTSLEGNDFESAVIIPNLKDVDAMNKLTYNKNNLMLFFKNQEAKSQSISYLNNFGVTSDLFDVEKDLKLQIKNANKSISTKIAFLVLNSINIIVLIILLSFRYATNDKFTFKKYLAFVTIPIIVVLLIAIYDFISMDLEFFITGKTGISSLIFGALALLIPTQITATILYKKLKKEKIND